MPCARVADARMDPWCVVPMSDGQSILFGFAIRHPMTGGLSWVCSTPVRYIDETSGRATTASGRRYSLGRRIDQHEIPAEGDEAWLAYDLLVSHDVEDADAVPPISADRGRDADWIGACKMARHLGLPAPTRAPDQVQDFIRRNINAYLRRRAAARPN